MFGLRIKSNQRRLRCSGQGPIDVLKLEVSLVIPVVLSCCCLPQHCGLIQRNSTPRKKKKRGPPMSEAAKAWLKASDKGSYYKQAALLDTEEQSDRPGDPYEKSKATSVFRPRAN